MSDVTRYSEGDYMDPRPFPHKHGDWVEYEAYQNLEAQLAEARASYNDLLMQVVHKIPGESRHDTARRIIQQHEAGSDEQAIAGQGGEECQ